MASELVPAGAQELDPFSFHVGSASRMAGFGGEGRPPEPEYLFHTPYVDAAPGVCNFVVQFVGLTARRGVLQLLVHMLPKEPGALARVVNSERITFNRITDQHGRIAIRFESFHGVSFALHARIVDDTDARAGEIIVYLDRPPGGEHEGLGLEARNTAYVGEAIKPVGRIRSPEPAYFADPVSQPATGPQRDERPFKDWCAAFGIDADAVAAWDSAFVLQAVRRYGALATGVRALALEGGETPAIRAATDLGLEVETFDGDTAGMPRELVNFDVAWSSTLLDRLVPIGQRIAMVDDVLARMRPGGLIVLTFGYDLESIAESGGDRTGGFNRFDIDRLALLLISRNHQVAQIRFDPTRVIDWTDGERQGRFGFIARKAGTAY